MLLHVKNEASTITAKILLLISKMSNYILHLKDRFTSHKAKVTSATKLFFVRKNNESLSRYLGFHVFVKSTDFLGIAMAK